MAEERLRLVGGPDLRLVTEEELQRERSVIIAAALGGTLGAYACEFDGNLFTALAHIEPPRPGGGHGGRPLALLLPQDAWVSMTDHRSDDYGPVRDW